MTSDRRVPLDLTICDLAVECETWAVKRPNGLPHVTGALIRFRGKYPYGSGGSAHAMFINWRIRELCEVTRPRALIVDFRELDYEWGDNLSVSSHPDLALVRIVIEERGRQAFAGVLGTTELRTDFDAALREVDEALRALKPQRRAAAKEYAWTEAWMARDVRDVLLLSHALTGEYDIRQVGFPETCDRSLDSEIEAVKWLTVEGYARVTGRRC